MQSATKKHNSGRNHVVKIRWASETPPSLLGGMFEVQSNKGWEPVSPAQVARIERDYIVHWNPEEA